MHHFLSALVVLEGKRKSEKQNQTYETVSLHAQKRTGKNQQSKVKQMPGKDFEILKQNILDDSKKAPNEMGRMGGSVRHFEPGDLLRAKNECVAQAKPGEIHKCEWAARANAKQLYGGRYWRALESYHKLMVYGTNTDEEKPLLETPLITELNEFAELEDLRKFPSR